MEAKTFCKTYISQDWGADIDAITKLRGYCDRLVLTT